MANFVETKLPICSEAQPNSVYVSRTVTDLVAGGPIQFQPQGERKLKGIDRPIEVFSVSIGT